MITMFAIAAMAVSSHVSEVTVYNDRAQVVRTAEAELSAGFNTIVFENLPEAVDARGIQVDGAGAATVLDVRFKTENLEQVDDATWQVLFNRRDNLQAEQRRLNQKIERLNAAKVFLGNIRSSVTHTPREGAAPELDPARWEAMLELQADRGAEYDEGIRTANRELKSVKDSLRKVEADIRDAGAGERRQRRIVEVDLEAPAAGSARIDLSYLVLGPGWQPVYDVRVDSGSRSMEVNYFALVRQNSGEDWSGVDLRLSTARPGLGGEHPELAVWRIGVANDAGLGGQSINRFPNSFDVETGQRTAPVVRSAGLVLDSVVAGVRRDMTVRQAENSTQGTAVLFAVSGKSDVVSDNVEHRVAVSSLSMPAHFRYSCVPKLDRYVYLKAMGKNQTDYPLLQGNANIYLDGSYVATSGLDFVAPGETFWAFLGVDESIQVDYKLINKHESREGLTGRTVRHTHEYLFTVKNTHDEAEELIIFDQLPISDNENVEVELLTPKVAKNSDALEINDEKRIKWFLVLKPGEEREIPFVFQVEAPHDVEIDGLE